MLRFDLGLVSHFSMYVYLPPGALLVTELSQKQTRVLCCLCVHIIHSCCRSFFRFLSPVSGGPALVLLLSSPKQGTNNADYRYTDSLGVLSLCSTHTHTPYFTERQANTKIHRQACIYTWHLNSKCKKSRPTARRRHCPQNPKLAATPIPDASMLSTRHLDRRHNTAAPQSQPQQHWYNHYI